MSTITLAIVIVFVFGYLCIALETVTKVNKAAVALLMLVATWTLYMFDPGNFVGVAPGGIAAAAGSVIEGHLGSTATTLFFLMGAMIIVETVDQYGGFNFVAFSPIGDVTTIMLWNKGLITAAGVIKELFIPSIVSVILPAYILSRYLKGDVVASVTGADAGTVHHGLSERQRKTVFWLGVGGLIFVPIFKSITHVPPFVGILLVLGALWLATELFYRHQSEHEGAGETQKRIVGIISRIDMSTILFFLGILMAVGCLQQIGVLASVGRGLDTTFEGNHYLVTGIIGVLSSIVDNVPLVAGCMGMYPIAEVGDMAQDGIFWQLLAYCAGVGGSMLIIGSAAGVVVMGLEKITFGWYMKRISWIAFLGYVAGIAVYWLEKTVIGL